MRALWIVVCVGIGCRETQSSRPGPVHFDPTLGAAARFVAALASGDVPAIQGMLWTPLDNGGVWFADPVCSAEFGHPGKVAEDKLAAFAKCLATLHLELNPRQHSMVERAVFSYPPGIELEASFRLTGGVVTIHSIGFVSRDPKTESAPTIAPVVLEGLRADQESPPALAERLANDLAVTGRDHAFAWLKICLDATGEVTVQPRDASSSIAQDAFADVARSWKFNPMMLNGQPTPVCSVVRLVYPAGKGPQQQLLPPEPGAILVVPPTALAANRVSGEKNIVPDDFAKSAMQASPYSQIVGSFKVCLDETGKITSVRMLKSSGLLSYDRKIIRTIESTWRYSPFKVDGVAKPVCTAATFIYSQR